MNSLSSLDGCYLQEEGIIAVCDAYENFHNKSPQNAYIFSSKRSDQPDLQRELFLIKWKKLSTDTSKSYGCENGISFSQYLCGVNRRRDLKAEQSQIINMEELYRQHVFLLGHGKKRNRGFY